MRTVLTLLGIAALIYIGACVALFFFQRSLIYFPQPSAHGNPAERMKLQATGAEVHVSHRPHNEAKAVIYFGGNAEDVSGSLPELAAAFPERAIYLMHYRGYGDSTGSPSEAALHADALLLFDKVHATQPDITVIGRSLGTGVAVKLATERPVSRLVLVTPYDNLQDIAATQFPVFPVRWLLQDKFDSGRLASRVTAPTSIIAAEHDEVIPKWSTEQLSGRFQKGIATMHVIPRTGHNTISDSRLYLELLRGQTSPNQPSAAPAPSSQSR